MSKPLTQAEMEHLYRTGSITLIHKESVLETFAPLAWACFWPSAIFFATVQAVLWMVNNP